MDIRGAFSRVCALLGTTVVVAAVLPAAPAVAATAAITNVSPNTVINSGKPIITLTTTNTYENLPNPSLLPTVQVIRHGFTSSSTPNSLPTSGVSVGGTGLPSNMVSVTVDFTAANPGTYDITVNAPANDPQMRQDTCSSCLTVFGFQPSVSSVSPSTVGEGTPASAETTGTGTYPGFQNFVINGQNFDRGFYEQCALADCSATGPSVAVRNHGMTTSDPNVAILDTVNTTSGSSVATLGTASQITLRMNVTGTDTTDYFDDIVVTNSDGKSATLPNALHILPRPTVDSVALAATGGTTIGRNATGQTLTLTGHDFLPTTMGIKFIPPVGAPTSPAPTISFTQPPVISGDGTTITLNGVNTTGVQNAAAALGAWSVVVTDPTIHAASAPKTLTVDDAPAAAPPVAYLDSSRTDGVTALTVNSSANGQYFYGQGAQGVRFVVPVTGPFVAGTGVDGTTHTHVVFTNLPAGVHLIDETATTGPNVVIDTFNIDPGTTIGAFTFKLQNPDGGTSDADCTNAVTGQNGVTMFNKENSCDLSIDAAPVISTIANATQPAGTSGGSITISGAHFHGDSADSLGTANNLVHVTISRGNTTYVDGDFTPTVPQGGGEQVTVTGINIPANETEGAADVTVKNNDDKGITVCAGCFHVSAVTITSVSPVGNTNDGSIPITISGQNYNPHATFVLQMNGVETISATGDTTVSQDPNSVNPADKIATATYDLTGAAPGFYDVIVTNPTGPHQGSATLSQGFQVLANPPTASTVAPSALGGGATNVAVTMTGTNIFPGAQLSFSSSSVTLDGSPVISPDHTSITQHVDVASNATSNVGTVKIVNTDGQASGTKAFTVDPAPVVNSIAPTSKANGASFTMTITGSGFSPSPAPTVTFSNPHVTGSVTAVSNAGDSLTVSVQIANDVAPTTPVAVHVTVTNADSGVAQSPTDLTVNPLPTFDSTTPASLADGANVPQFQIFGTGFQSNATVALDPQSATGITFGTPNTVSSTEIDVPVTVDANAASGARTFDVTNADGGMVPGTVTVITVPSAPQTVTANGGARSITVHWAAPADDGGSPITHYTVSLTKQGDPSTSAVFITADGTARQHTFTTTDNPVAPLQNATTYVVQVLATNAAGNSAAAPPGGLAATTATVPGAPTAVHVVPGDARATVSWTAPASDGGASITDYVVSATPGTHTVTTADGTTLHAVVTGLTNGVAYRFTVYAQNGAGNGPTSTPVSATPKYVTTITIANTHSAVVYGNKVTLSGRLTRSNGTGISRASVLVFRMNDNHTTNHIATVTTSSTGTWSYPFTPAVDGTYYARFLGDAVDASSGSRTTRTTVAPVVKITSPANKSSSSHTTTLTVKGTVGPNLTGKYVSLNYINSSGSLVRLQLVKLTTGSVFTFSVKLARGTWRLEVVIGPTPTNVSGHSPVLTVFRT
jgi:hypothetical protein